MSIPTSDFFPAPDIAKARKIIREGVDRVTIEADSGMSSHPPTRKRKLIKGIDGGADIFERISPPDYPSSFRIEDICAPIDFSTVMSSNEVAAQRGDPVVFSVSLRNQNYVTTARIVDMIDDRCQR